MTLRFFGEPQEDKRLRRMIFISAILHVLVIIGVLASSALSRSLQPRAVAYTVELVNLDRLSTNLPGGEKKSVSTLTEAASSPRTSPPPLANGKLQPNIVEKERPKLSPLPQQQAKVEKIAEKEKPIEKPLVKPEPDKAKVVEKKSELQPIKPNPEPQKTAKANEPKPNAETTASKVETKKTETKPVESQKNNVQEVEKKKHEPQKTETKPDEVVTEKSDAKQEQSVPAKAEVKKTEEKPTNTEELSPDDRDRRIAAALARIQAQTQAQGKPSLSEEEKGTGPVTKGGEFGEGGGGVVRGVEFLIYTQQLQKRVQENWIVAEKKPGLVASVSFMIEPNGNVQEFEMTQSSGDSAFDQSVMRAIRKAAPFPPPPQSYVQEFATQKIVMNFGGEGRVN